MGPHRELKKPLSEAIIFSPPKIKNQRRVNSGGAGREDTN
jgi:hypothetical protein